MRTLTVLAAASLALFAPPAIAAEAATKAAPPTKETIAAMQAALAHARRDGDRARDAFRHPAETLEFFKVDPGMTVIDYMPSSGWYTRVLVPFLGKDGRYIGLNPALGPGASEGLVRYFGGLKEKFPVAAAKWNLSGAPVEAFNTDEVGEDHKGTVDRVLIFREIHNLHRRDFMRPELARLRELLKDDGLLGVVQHRAKADAPAAYANGDKGYMREKDVIALFEVNGFELVAASEINANPKDGADYPMGVWELAPVSRTKRDELKPIGESDRMTLLFRKRP